MKIHVLILLLILFSPDCFPQDIIGIWKYEKTDTEVITIGDKQVAKEIADNLKGLFKGSTIRFTTDGKIYNGDEMGEYAIDGDTIEDILSGIRSKYSIKGDTLVIDFDIFRFEKISEEKLKQEGIEKLILKMCFSKLPDDYIDTHTDDKKEEEPFIYDEVFQIQ